MLTHLNVYLSYPVRWQRWVYSISGTIRRSLLFFPSSAMSLHGCRPQERYTLTICLFRGWFSSVAWVQSPIPQSPNPPPPIPLINPQAQQRTFPYSSPPTKPSPPHPPPRPLPTTPTLYPQHPPFSELQTYRSHHSRLLCSHCHCHDRRSLWDLMSHLSQNCPKSQMSHSSHFRQKSQNCQNCQNCQKSLMSRWTNHPCCRSCPLEGGGVRDGGRSPEGLGDQGRARGTAEGGAWL